MLKELGASDVREHNAVDTWDPQKPWWREHMTDLVEEEAAGEYEATEREPDAHVREIP
jgi:hypothetical protein